MHGMAGSRAKSALVLGDYAVTTRCNPRDWALFVMQHNCWDHGLKVTDDGAGLGGHGGGVLLRKLADQCGLTAALEAALARAGKSPQLSRAVVFVSMAIAIALGAPAA